MQAFSLNAQFARESATLKLPKERRRWGESKGAGRGWRILGDPGADKGGEGNSKRAEKYIWNNEK